MTDVGVSFGAAVYDASRKLSGYDCITYYLDYAAIQALKHADRDGTARIFAAYGPDIVALIASGEPEDLARQLLLARQEKLRQSESFNTIVFWCF
jgi:hypothetical protein